MNKLNFKQILVIFSVIIYLVSLFGFGFGLFYCTSKVDGIDPSDLDLAFFGVGLCGLPYLVLLGSIVPFAQAAYKEFISFSVNDKNTGSAEPGSGKNQP